LHGPLAQLVEQETLNLLVVGSIPTRPTIQPSADFRRAPGKSTKSQNSNNLGSDDASGVPLTAKPR
jgi:hypothetical protein